MPTSETPAAYIDLGFCVRREADGALIPKDPANRDFAEFLAWVAAGGTPERGESPLGDVPQGLLGAP